MKRGTRTQFWPETLEVLDRGLEMVRGRHSIIGTEPKAFHDDFHALEVIGAGLTICDELQASDEIRNMVVVAGAWHDAFQDQGKQNELLSAVAADEAMRDVGLGARFRDTVGDMIMATVVRVENGVFMQSAETLEQKILADADMSNIGRDTPYYRARGLKLFEERYPDEPADGKAMIEFLNSSETVLRTHTYYLEASERRFPHQRQNYFFALALKRHLSLQLEVE